MTAVPHRLQLPRPDPFVLLMLCMVSLASLWPDLGASNGPLRLGGFASLGVSLVFFLSGAGLSPSRLRAGLLNWKLHLFVQASTFLLFPLLGLLAGLALGRWLPPELVLGLFFLCALPSTISTSIAMTALGRGNVAGAVFNATLSSLLGMVLTPVLVGLWMHGGGQGGDLGRQFLSIAWQLLLPFAAGQALRPLICRWIEAHRPLVSRVDRGSILLIVLNTFSDSVQEGLWTRYGPGVLVQALAIAAGLLAVVLPLTRWTARRLGFPVEDEIAAVFCGSKKSMATGIPMAKLLFAGAPSLGLIVLPILFYHQLQLLVCSVMAQRYARREPPLA